jgi:hypothetical protein
MWIVADYEPVAAFSLRPSNTTSTGGKSLLVPTPYAIKMALLDRMIRVGGLDYGVARFPLVRDLTIWLGVPRAAAVNPTFQKVLRPGGAPWNETIAQREYVFHAGIMTVAFGLDEGDFAGDLMLILPAINYFGRKGSFMQYVGHQTQPDAPAHEGFVDLCREADALGFGFLQLMDNMRPNATFEEVSVFGNPRSDGGRVSYNVILPYRLAYHGFNHTIYEAESGP